MASTIDVLVNLQAIRNGRPGRVFHLVVHVEAATRRLKFNHATPAEMYKLLILNLTCSRKTELYCVKFSDPHATIRYVSRKWRLALYYRYFRNWIKISIWENHSKGGSSLKASGSYRFYYKSFFCCLACSSFVPWLWRNPFSKTTTLQCTNITTFSTCRMNELSYSN